MADLTANAKRERLEGYIADSRRVQRRLRYGCLGSLPFLVLIWAIASRFFIPAAVIVAAITGVGWYITSQHIIDWENQLAADDEPPV